MKLFVPLFAALLSLSQASALAVQARSSETYCYPDAAIPLYRAYNPSLATTDHFYTTSATEMANAVDNLGYSYEGETALVFGSQEPSTIPLYRLFNPTIVDHFYTTSASERDNAIDSLGYSSEGTAAYVYSTEVCGSIPLYRMYSASLTDHFYTTSASERDNAEENLSYSDEGIAAYVLPA